MGSAVRLKERYTKEELRTGIYLMIDGTIYLGEPVYSIFTDQEENKLIITFEDRTFIQFKGIRYQLQ